MPPSPLAALVARVDEERSAHAVDSGDLSARHKALVRAAGRAALEDTLNPSKRAPELTIESLTAEWLAYAEVFGTNGMAAGGAGSAVTSSGKPMLPEKGEAKAQGPTRRGHLALGIFAALVALLAAVHRSRSIACTRHG